MSDPGQKKPRNFKMLLSATAIALVICVAPIGSYFFLKGGFDYRLESLNQLQPKELSKELNTAIEKYAPFEGNARLIHIPGEAETSELSVLQVIDDQIVDRARFDIFSFAQKRDIGKNKIEFIDVPKMQSDFDYILIDTSNIVRGAYQYHPRIGDEIIRHLSVVIPMPEQRSITLNRNKE